MRFISGELIRTVADYNVVNGNAAITDFLLYNTE